MQASQSWMVLLLSSSTERVPLDSGRSFPLILLLKGIRILYAPMSFMSTPSYTHGLSIRGCLHLL